MSQFKNAYYELFKKSGKWIYLLIYYLFSWNIFIQFIIKQYKYTLVHMMYWMEKHAVYAYIKSISILG